MTSPGVSCSTDTPPMSSALGHEGCPWSRGPIASRTARTPLMAYQVPLTEPATHNAIHGFGRWRNWICHGRTESQVVMGIVLHPQMGYPFTLDVRVDYQLSEAGLIVRTTAVNIGAKACPYGTGQHPYLRLDTDLIDDCELQLQADTWLPTDERGLPTGPASVDGSPYDFRGLRQIGARDVDYAFTDLVRDSDGLAWVQLSAPERGTLALWADESYGYIQIYTAHTQHAPHWRTGLGVEPMTCPPMPFAAARISSTWRPDTCTPRLGACARRSQPHQLVDGVGVQPSSMMVPGPVPPLRLVRWRRIGGRWRIRRQRRWDRDDRVWGAVNDFRDLPAAEFGDVDVACGVDGQVGRLTQTGRDLDRLAVGANRVDAAEWAIESPGQGRHEQLPVRADLNIGGHRFGDIGQADHARR